MDKVPLCITIGDADIESTQHATFLGLEIDENLDYSKHVEKLTPKLNTASIFLLRKLSYEVSESERKIAYYANVYSLIKFNIIFWGDSRFAKKHIFPPKICNQSDVSFEN
jgi:hypothetical protein